MGCGMELPLDPSHGRGPCDAVGRNMNMKILELKTVYKNAQK
jgi:hypothetical protein